MVLVRFALLLFCVISHGNNIAAYSMDLLELLVLDSPTSNPLCKQHSAKLRNAIMNQEIWAWKMVDSSSKVPAGIFYGSSADFGHFDQCLSIAEDEFSGKHCLASVELLINNASKNENIWSYVKSFENKEMHRPRNKLKFGFCIPSSCDETDLENHLRAYSKNIKIDDVEINIKVPVGSCRIPMEYEYDFYDYLFLYLIASIVGLVVVSTIVDKIGLKGNKTIIHAIIKSFSMSYNMRKLCEEYVDVDKLNCIHGMRVISTFVVVIVHIVLINLQSPMHNLLEVEKWNDSGFFRFILSLHAGIDLFFILTAFLTTYILLHDLESKKPINYLRYYIHRFIRCMPLNALIIFFYATIFSKLSSSPIWNDVMIPEQEKCIKNWWASLFNVNNYINSDEICAIQTWFLSASMQMFIMTPPLVIFIHKNPKKGLGLIIFLIAFFSGLTFYLTYFGDFDAIVIFSTNISHVLINETFRNNYIPTHVRISPYLFGVIAAYLRFQIKMGKVKLPKIPFKIGYWMSWVIFISTMYFSMNYSVNRPNSRFVTALYSTLYHLAIGISMNYGIIAMSTGLIENINAFFAWRGFIPYSKITYSVNMVNFSIVMFVLATTRLPLSITKFYLIWHLSSTLVITYMIGFIVYLCFEAPFINLDKFLLNSKPKLPPPKQE